MSAKNDARRKWGGGHWITPVRRIGIYLRDSMACVWCESGVEDGIQLSLDHLKCNVKGGGNENANLITCCTHCNSTRAHRSVTAFARVLAAYLNHGVTPEQIVRRVRAAARREVPIAQARELLAARGGIKEVVNNHQPKGETK